MRQLATVDREIEWWTQRLAHTTRDGRATWGHGYDSRMAAIHDALASLWAERARLTA
jgi:hypothetical protein